MTEEKILRHSLIGILLVSGMGIGFGLVSGSFAIMFDGVFSLIDAAMTVLSLHVARLIGKSVSDRLPERLRQRYTFGFWHFEPMVLALNATILLSVTVYAGLTALMALASGGRAMAFGPALAYAAVVVVICAAMALWEQRANRRVRSEFVAMDVRGWIMAGAVTGALLLAFGIGAALNGGAYAWLMPYIDPAVLVLVCAVLVPVPVATLRRAVSELAMVTPPDLLEQVDEVAMKTVQDQGFDGHRSAVARTGRATQIEIYFIVPPNQPARPLEYWDGLRDQIGDALGGPSPHRWLTIAITTDPARAST